MGTLETGGEPRAFFKGTSSKEHSAGSIEGEKGRESERDDAKGGVVSEGKPRVYKDDFSQTRGGRVEKGRRNAWNINGLPWGERGNWPSPGKWKTHTPCELDPVLEPE